MANLRVLLVAASTIVCAYRYTAFGLSRLCGCSERGSSLQDLALCVGDALASGRCVDPNHAVKSLFESKEFCVEPGVGDVGTLLLASPSSDTHSIAGADVGYKAGCKIESVQLGFVPQSDASEAGVTHAGACASFTKTKELDFTLDEARSTAVPHISFKPVNSADGNALLFTGRGCDFGHVWDARVHAIYGKIEGTD